MLFAVLGPDDLLGAVACDTMPIAVELAVLSMAALDSYKRDCSGFARYPASLFTVQFPDTIDFYCSSFMLRQLFLYLYVIAGFNVDLRPS